MGFEIYWFFGLGFGVWGLWVYLREEVGLGFMGLWVYLREEVGLWVYGFMGLPARRGL
jgi:hypothetical protein